MKTLRVLCVDDDVDFLSSLKRKLSKNSTVFTASTISSGLSVLQTENIDMVLLDVELGNENGVESIRKFRSQHPNLDIVMLSGRRDPKTVVEAVRAGAIDYLTKPFDVDEFAAIVERQKNTWKLRERYDALIETQNTAGAKCGIVHKSACMSKLLSEVSKLKGSFANVIIFGESGTGKELFARFIHSSEGNPSRPFVAINCAAIPDTLMEAELFGAEAGSFTGSIKKRIGKFELADGGDIFLDEVGILKSELQAKLLRVLQEQEFCRVGGNETICANFRVIAATNSSLEEKIGRGAFRSDLYHRLRVIQFTIPPLRDRREDIPLLVEHYLRKHSRDNSVKSISPEALKRLTDYSWPGNVRELSNVVNSLAILSSENMIDVSTFPSWTLNGCGENLRGGLPSIDETVGSLKEYVTRAERHFIEHTIRIFDGNKSQIADALNLSRTSLYKKIKELEIE